MNSGHVDQSYVGEYIQCEGFFGFGHNENFLDAKSGRKGSQ